jgi:hypothetical protein
VRIGFAGAATSMRFFKSYCLGLYWSVASRGWDLSYRPSLPSIAKMIY